MGSRWCLPGTLHAVMMMHRRRLSRLGWPARIHAIHATSFSRGDHSVCPGCIFRVVQQATNVVYKQWIEEISNFLLVGKIKCTLEWNPVKS